MATFRAREKALEVVAADTVASHFFRNGRYTKFVDWWFVHRVRLYLISMNAYIHREGVDKKGTEKIVFTTILKDQTAALDVASQENS